MAHFSIEQIQEIHDKLLELGVKDSQLPIVNNINGTELIPILQDNSNKLVRVSKIGTGGDIILNKPLVTPIIYGNWYINGEFNSNKIIEVPYGEVISWIGYYIWKEEEGFKNPTDVNEHSSFYKYNLPSSGLSSNILTISNIKDSIQIIASILAPINGLFIQDGVLINAEGLETTLDYVEVYFKNKVYYGESSDRNIANLQGLLSTSLLYNDKELINLNNITTNNSKYFIIGIPYRMGLIDCILLDEGLDIKEAFTYKIVNIINNNITIPYIIFISNNKGAFTNKNINIKFKL